MVARREHKLADEVDLVILRLLQLRDSKKASKTRIDSVKYQEKELLKISSLKDLDLSILSPNEARRIATSAGFPGIRRNSKVDISINDEKFGIRCLNFTDRALINHSNRLKYLKVCQHIGCDISELDSIIDTYWKRRLIGAFNEDCNFSTNLNPFINHDRYLKPILTAIAFNSYDYMQEPGTKSFVKEKLDNILDYVNPIDESTWHVYNPDNYYDNIKQHLCFSMRDNKGMPSDDRLSLPQNKDILPWVHQIDGKYKGALHIRIKKFDASKHKTERFEVTHANQIRETTANIGERDELLLKLFLIECRYKKMVIPIGEKKEIVTKVGSKDIEYDEPTYWQKWDTLDATELVYICTHLKAGKAGRYAKSDVYINGIGISVKSKKGAPPAIINHTTRDKILRVMKSLNSPIIPLDQIIGKYWELRKDGMIKEDISTIAENTPFTKEQDCIPKSLHDLLNYFSFDGTGTRDSEEPAALILSMDDPFDTKTWNYYDKKSFIPSIWNSLVFSLRSKSMPKNFEYGMNQYAEIEPWVRDTINSKTGEVQRSGALHVRVSK